MEPEHSWPRGRHGWNNDGLRSGLREGDIQSARRMHHSGSPSHKFRPNRPIWDDTIHDLASMRLNQAELARKLASRQSSNKLLARAQLLEQSRWSGSYSPNLPPALAARLQAARQQSVDFILAQSNSALMASQKMRQSDTSSPLDLKAMQRHQEPDGAEEVSLYEYDVKQEGPRKTNLQNDGFDSSTNDHDEIRPVRVDMKNETVKSHDIKNKTETSTGTSKETGQKDLPEGAPKQKASSSKSTKETRKPFDISQCAATRASLDHTITMVVNTCRELWLQLEEERFTRERLQQQLQQQGNVITTLTAELLQIQDQQEAILQEIREALASDQSASSVPDGNSASTQLNYANLPHEGLPDVKSSDKDMRAIGDNQTVASDNKENNLMSMGDDNVMDSSITELLERKSPEDFQKCIIYQCQVV
ncbi:uncharacterized protein [Panulirus ornatus]|uniref:uncharacterized protein isoform X2 n=1 Tax=Panulirus ornatus TaxID=150431 RepID=UPI003A87F1A0